MIKLLKFRIMNSEDHRITVWAKKLGLSQPVLWRWLKGEREVNLTGIRAIATHFRDDKEMIAALTDYALNGTD